MILTASASSILVPIVKGFGMVVGGASVIGGATYYYSKYSRSKDPLTPVLISAAPEKSFSENSLVSRSIQHNGTIRYKYKVPTGLSLEDILSIVPAIEAKLDCKCEAWTEEGMFIFELQTKPLPKKLVFTQKEIVKELQKSECAFYLGVGRLGHVLVDLSENSTPHLMFGGSTGGGKSNLINQGICGMLEAYSPAQLNLYLIDLKDGVELRDYEDVEHVKAFWDNVTAVNNGLDSILGMISERNNLFKQYKGCKKLSQYNQISPNPLPRIVLIADEFAQFNNIADKKLKAEVMTKWESLLQLGRSAGVHVIAGTQVADADAFPKQIKGNMDARFGFKVPQRQHSDMIMGSTCLLTLPNINGRGIFKIGTKFTEVQVPLLESDKYEEILAKHTIERVSSYNMEETETEEKENEVEQITMVVVENEDGEESITENENVCEPVSDVESLFTTESALVAAN